MEIYVANYLSGACAPALLLDDAQTAVHRPVGGGMVFASKWGPKWTQNGSQMALRRSLGAPGPPEGLLERSWRPLGAVSDASWALLERAWKPLGRSWVYLVRSWGGLGGVLRAKRLPKLSPGGSQIESRRRYKLKTRSLQKPLFLK